MRKGDKEKGGVDSTVNDSEDLLVNKIIHTLHLTYPDSKCSLDFTNEFELLVGTILSAQTTDKMVNAVLPALLRKYPSPGTMANAEPDDIKPYIHKIGLYNNKAKSLVNMARQLVEQYDSQVPRDMKQLIKLKGVGRKTANVVLGVGMDIVVGITVDTHVTRLANRIGWTTETDPKKIEQDLMAIVPKEEWVNITHLLIDHGRKVCGRKPKCDDCTIREMCKSAFQFDRFKV